MTNTDAFDKGYQAHFDDARNPYKKGTASHLAWQQGKAKAKKDDKPGPSTGSWSCRRTSLWRFI